ncbi:MAG TPA: hypothetical protein VHE35_34250 [Kofleriaceae bacterium]|nr:hypothetical protein [Kofleriaceae bacterium]
MTRRIAVLLALSLLTGLGRPALADDTDHPAKRPFVDGRLRQDGIGIEVGVIAARGATEYGVPKADLAPDVEGLVLRDRNGMTARMVIGLVIAVASAMAQSGPKSVESHSYIEGDYLVTETKTTYYSEEEKAEMQAEANGAIDGLFAAPYSDMELEVFSRDRFGRGDASGYHLNFFAGSGKPIAFETGFGFGKVSSMVEANGMPTKVDWKYFGMPFRVSTAAGPVRLALTYEWNWLKYGVDGGERVVHPDADGNPIITAVSHPWHFDVSTVVAHRLSLSAGLTAQQIKKPGELGFTAQAGLLF